MPVYNAGKYVGKSIESILSQTYTNLELIIVNDGSTDNSREVILSYKDPRIKYFENDSNLNIVKTRNRCISESSGEYIAVLDSDDIAFPDRLEKQLEFLEANPEYGMCGTYYHIINENNEYQSRIQVPLNDLDNKTFLNFNVCFCHSTVMMRSELAKKIKYREGYDIIEDYEITYNISKIAKIANLPIYSTHYRVHGNNVTIAKKEKAQENRKKIDETVLTDLGIDFTQAELALHTNFISFNYEYFVLDSRYKELEKWLLGYYAFSKKKNRFNMQLIARSFITRWFLICIKNKKYSWIFFNRLLFKFHFLYPVYISEFLAQKHRKSYYVV